MKVPVYFDPHDWELIVLKLRAGTSNNEDAPIWKVGAKHLIYLADIISARVATREKK